MTDAILYAWIADALEPGHAAQVAAKVAGSADLQARVAELSGRLAQPPPAPRWRLPPPGIQGGRQAVGLRAQLPLVMGESRLRPGDRFQVRITAPADSDTRNVVVLRRSEGNWQVVYPTAPDETLPLALLPTEGEDRVLDLTAGEPPGTQRWAIALPHADLSAEWSNSEPWDRLHQGIHAGLVPVTSFDVRVDAA